MTNITNILLQFTTQKEQENMIHNNDQLTQNNLTNNRSHRIIKDVKTVMIMFLISKNIVRNLNTI